MAAKLDMSSLSLRDSPRLEDLPLDILLIVISYLHTAKSVASLASTCKKLHGLALASGWRIFVRSHFGSLSLPQQAVAKDASWLGLARELTWQSRSWDRRAFSMASLAAPPVKKPPPARDAQGARGGNRLRLQTIPPHIVVDAFSQKSGKVEEEIVAWGAGEDVVVRKQRRQSGRSSIKSEVWSTIDGAAMSFKSGEDDVTAISILEDSTVSSGLLVGRASGQLQLLSTRQPNFGQAIASFSPRTNEEGTGIEQRDIQGFDINGAKDVLAVVTKDNALLYPLKQDEVVDTIDSSGTSSSVVVEPTEALDIRNMEGSRQFRFLRAVKFMGNGDLAVGTTSSSQPLRYLTRTPSGLEMLNASKLQPSERCTSSYIYDNDMPQTVRGLLPISPASVPGGSGSVMLSSYDDGTIRMQDLRSPSPVDTIYQDHFELTTPVGPLLSYGLDRFVAGSARTSTLKIFDFRWTKSYNYTESLPCGRTPLEPAPKSLTMVSFPDSTEAEKCNYLLGRSCNRHALARTDFYRPNCNLYLPAIHQPASPIYSLAKASDLSSTIYAGLAGELVTVNLRDRGEQPRENLKPVQGKDKKGRAGYSYHECLISIVETGDGFALSDISKSQRVPEIRKQSQKPTMPAAMQKMYRLDSLLM